MQPPCTGATLAGPKGMPEALLIWWQMWVKWLMGQGVVSVYRGDQCSPFRVRPFLTLAGKKSVGSPDSV